MVEKSSATEPVRLPERFTTENQLTALYARLAMNGEALNPKKKDLTAVKEADLNNLQTTIEKAATASTVERSVITYKKDQWAQMMVDHFGNAGNAPYVARLAEKKIGGIDFAHPNGETFLSLYQRYFADEGQGTQVEVIIKDEKQYIPSRLNKFIEDVLAAYPNRADLKADMETIQWYAGIFGGESKKIIRSILEAKLILDDAPQKQKLITDANEKAKKDDREISRLNWLGGQSGEEERQLQFLWKNSHGVQRKMIDRTVTAPPPQPPQPPRPPAPMLPSEPAPPAEPLKPVVVTGEELKKMPKDERLQNLPLETLHAATGFCEVLRKRMMEEGSEEPIRENNQDLLKIVDPVTKKIHVNVRKREYVENAWFHTADFIDWASENGLPLFYLVPGGMHAQLLLKLEQRGGKNGYVYYDPLSDQGEQWREFANQITLKEHIAELIKKGELKEKTIEIDNKKTIQYIRPAVTGQISIGESIANDSELFESWLHTVLPVQFTENALALQLLMKNQYDLTLENDPDFPDNIKKGKIQRMQFDGKNCVPISFFHAALRYAAKPGDNEFKRKGIKKFEEDFGVKILTREEILRSDKDEIPIGTH